MKIRWPGVYSTLTILFMLVFSPVSKADTGYELWLNYKPVSDIALQNQYAQYCAQIAVAKSKHAEVIRKELTRSLTRMLPATEIRFSERSVGQGVEIRLGAGYGVSTADLEHLTTEGYRIRQLTDKGKRRIVIQSCGDAGLLYGTFHLIRLMQCGEPLDGIDISEQPAFGTRLLNHWDDLDGSVNWIDVGGSIWNWDSLPQYEDPRYEDYARANASIGINAMCIMTRSPELMTPKYLSKLSVIARVMERYNIRIFLPANFTAPVDPSKLSGKKQKYAKGIGTLPTADPFDPQVIEWWRQKAAEIHKAIPNFGGFIVKANSEGMPGPLDYNRTYADGANVIARAVKPFGGIVLWRTFVYNKWVDDDRAKRPYKEFIGLDGLFDDNVVLQTKNGPMDYQPVEPVHPLFGGMKKTQVMPELQIMQEYMGQTNYLVWLLPMWRQFFDFDTYCQGAGSTVGRLVCGAIYPYSCKTITGIANIGNDTNWTGHHFAQANWYAFGRLAWNPFSDSDKILSDWIHMTWHADAATSKIMKAIMMPSWESYAAGVTPFALGMTLLAKDHYSPAFENRNGRNWHADKTGIGNDRTSGGSDYVSQYHEPNRSRFDDIRSCPENMLLFFHFVDWEYRMPSGKSFRETFLESFQREVLQAEQNLLLWYSIRTKIDAQRYREVEERMERQLKDARTYYQSAIDMFTNLLDGDK